MGKSHFQKVIASLETRIAGHQLQLSKLSDRQKSKILSELLVKFLEIKIRIMEFTPQS